MGSKILKDGTVITWENDTNSLKTLHNASILITDGKIVAIADSVDQLSAPSDAEIIDVSGMIVTPGFVNTHSHMWQTAFRSMAPDIFIAQYFGWLSQMGSATKSFSASDIYISSLEGYCDGLNAGITSIVDHATANWNPDVVLPSFRAATDGGARVWWCHDLHPGDAQELATLEKIRDEIDSKGKLVSMGLAPDMFNWSDDAAVGMMEDVTKSLKPKIMTTHYLGGPWLVGRNSPEIASQRGFGSSSIPVIFSHSGFVTEADRKALRDDGNYISITAENEMSEGHGHVSSCLVHDHASLGTDTNWNISGDILHNARLWLQHVRTTKYQKVLDQGRTPRQNPMSVEDAFLLATRQGGQALHRNDIGVIEVGAKADLVCFDTNSPNMVGSSNAVAAVVLHSNVGDIKHVLVDGEFRKRDGNLITATQSWNEIRKQFAEVAKRIQKENASPPALPEKFWGGGEFGDVEIASVRK